MSNVLNRDIGKSDTQRSGVMTPDSGRVPTITGAGRGLGRAMTLGLARAGIRVVATAARERAEIESIAAEAGESMVLPSSPMSPEKSMRNAWWQRPWSDSAGWTSWSTTPAET